MERMHPLWWAAWLIHADALVSWTADSNAGSGRSDWAPHAGQTSLAFRSLVVPASRGLSYEECIRLTPHFSTGYEPQPRGPSGATIEQFDAQRSAARKVVVHAIAQTAAQRLTEGTIPGSRFRNVQTSILLERLQTTRVALPTYVFAYRYRDKVYRAVVHGQDMRCVFGTSPIAWSRVAVVVLLVAAVVILIVVLIAITR